MKHPAIHGLYAITDPALIPDRQLLPAAEAALRGGARLLQYRDKTATPEQRRQRAAQLQTLCRHHGALFLVNDDPALAAEIDADGVHIGQSDGGIARARRLLGPGKIIGVTCHSDLTLAEQAAAAGAEPRSADLGGPARVISRTYASRGQALRPLHLCASASPH